MHTIKTLKEKITSTIYPNGKGAINAADHQAMLLELVDILSTPSGDPMHRNYEVVGAIYNETNGPIVRTDSYGNLISHQSGCWYLEGVGDLSNADMRAIYEAGKWWISSDNKGFGGNGSVKTNLPSLSYTQVYYKNAYEFMQAFNNNPSLQAIDLRTQQEPLADDKFNRVTIKSMDFLCQGSTKIKRIYGTIDASLAQTSNSCWIHTPGLEEVRLYGIKTDVKLPLSKDISKASILYMINNETASSAINITLHSDAYARLSADADIVSSLANHPKVSLAKA
jgi:hypothetical protein